MILRHIFRVINKYQCFKNHVHSLFKDIFDMVFLSDVLYRVNFALIGEFSFNLLTCSIFELEKEIVNNILIIST